MSPIEIILALLGLVGIGGIIANVQTKYKELSFKALENKERRYKSCLLYMDVYFNPANIKYLSSRQSDIHSSSDVIEYLRAEYHEMILYAAKPVILSVKAFIEHPSRDNFLTSVLAMRQDLWTKQSNLTIGDIALAKGDA
jgi:hypothetical protein